MNHSPEIVALDPSNGFSSGGGFSSYFPRPAYQDAVVPAYVKSLNGSFAGLYDPRGRAYPDIAAQGFHFITTWNGTDVLLDGTSASTPAASAILALVNDFLIASGRPPLGFLNPWLYSRGFKAFTDITSGSAIGCGTEGFPAQKGWDAVTGWGTPVSSVCLRRLNRFG
jgi:tripeptidyl-peptidase-1